MLPSRKTEAHRHCWVAGEDGVDGLGEMGGVVGVGGGGYGEKGHSPGHSWGLSYASPPLNPD